MTRTEKIEIMAKELAKSEQMPLEHCRRWIERGVAAVEAAEVAFWGDKFRDAVGRYKEAA